MARGRFITFEGGEGTGKSTQATGLAAFLKAAGLNVVATREPGGSAGGESIRELLVTGEVDRWSPTSETLLLNAARSDHLDRLIRPALGAGAIVICDRFADSTRAYQGAAASAPTELIEALERLVVQDTRPDLTLVLDLPAEVGLERAARRKGGETRFEAKGEAFHEALRGAFLDIVAREPRRCVLIDAAPDLAIVQEAVRRAVRERLNLP